MLIDKKNEYQNNVISILFANNLDIGTKNINRLGFLFKSSRTWLFNILLYQ